MEAKDMKIIIPAPDKSPEEAKWEIIKEAMADPIGVLVFANYVSLGKWKDKIEKAIGPKKMLTLEQPIIFKDLVQFIYRAHMLSSRIGQRFYIVDNLEEFLGYLFNGSLAGATVRPAKTSEKSIPDNSPSRARTDAEVKEDVK